MRSVNASHENTRHVSSSRAAPLSKLDQRVEAYRHASQRPGPGGGPGSLRYVALRSPASAPLLPQRFGAQRLVIGELGAAESSAVCGGN